MGATGLGLTGNLIFGAITVAIWGGVLLRYFWNDIRAMWERRNDPPEL